MTKRPPRKDNGTLSYSSWRAPSLQAGVTQPRHRSPVPFLLLFEAEKVLGAD